MKNTIQLLPDSVANQIAAGEVIQRPASVVKELLENAIDAGADDVTLIIKEAGKALIQVIDNGCGMNEVDARMCFERHATSKIKNANDLFALSTKGFRGEAMASIAAIAHIDLKTKLFKNELGVNITMEGSKMITKEPCTCPNGTSICVKNIFFNIPARRKFLKSNSVETKHIIDEFHRVALIHPEIGFSMFHNEQEIYHLDKATFRQRIASVFGKNYNERLVPIQEQTDIVNIDGFIGKPEFAKKTRGEQFFFVNNRFIKNHYLHHAILSSFEDLILSGSHPSYFIQLDIDASEIDINIHPTKTEIKFEDERSIYAILKASVKKSLNKFSIAPTLDFEQETSFNVSNFKEDKILNAPKIQVNPNFNPFDDTSNLKKNSQPRKESHLSDNYAQKQHWKNLYETQPQPTEGLSNNLALDQKIEKPQKQQEIIPQQQNQVNFYQQLDGRYILTKNKLGLLIIDQKRAHERVLFEHFCNVFKTQKVNAQQLLFPESMEFNAADSEILREVLPDLQKMGIDINEFGKNAFVVNGLPADLHEFKPKNMIEQLLEQYKLNLKDVKLERRNNLAKSLAQNIAIKRGQKLEYDEMKSLIEQLFLSSTPQVSPSGKATTVNISINEITGMLK